MLGGEKLVYDDNYSCTYGTFQYGIFKTMDEITEVAEIVDPGF